MVDDDEQAENDWYERMYAQCPSQALPESLALSKVDFIQEELFDINEDSYFENMSTQNATSVFLSENNSVWHKITSSLVESASICKNDAYLTQISNFDHAALFACREFLFMFLPMSSKLYVEICHICREQTKDRKAFKKLLYDEEFVYVDNVSKPSLVLLLRVETSMKKLQINIFSSVLDSNLNLNPFLKTLQCFICSENRNHNNLISLIDTIVFEAIDIALLEKMKTLFASIGWKEEVISKIEYM
jgi:hypothetical protein